MFETKPYNWRMTRAIGSVSLDVGLATVWFRSSQTIFSHRLNLPLYINSASQLDRALLPLFSISQFVAELQIFDDLPTKIGPGGQPGSAPFLPPYTPGGPVNKRNVTGICDDPATIARFNEIAATIKANANMEGILVNIQIDPYGVVCMPYPLNNTEDFPKGVYLDSTGVIGFDTLADPIDRPVAEATLRTDQVVVEGPISLVQCPTCDPVVRQAFIARLNIKSEKHSMEVNGKTYNSWGFAAVVINWQALVDRGGIYKSFSDEGFGFLLTRTDRITNQTTGVETDHVSPTSNICLLQDGWETHSLSPCSSSGCRFGWDRWLHKFFQQDFYRSEHYRQRVGHDDWVQPSRRLGCVGYRWNSPCFPSLLSALCNRYDPKSRIQNDGEEVLGWSLQPAKAPPKVILARERTYQRNLSWRGRPHIACQAVRWPVPKHNSSLSNLVGFTAAWSSVREPALVFQLLQTIFYEFDKIAKKRGVFKASISQTSWI